jgi:hypothetical protein
MVKYPRILVPLLSFAVANQLRPPQTEIIADECDRLASHCAQLEKQLESLTMREKVLSAKNRQLTQEKYLLQESIKSISERGRQLALELDLFRQRRLVVASDRFRNLFDAWHLMRPEFSRLKDDTMLFGGSLRGFRLMPSVNLMRVPYISYELNLDRPGLSAIFLAPALDFPAEDGELVVRVTSSDGAVNFAESSTTLVGVTDEAPVALRFPAISASDVQPLAVQVSVRASEVPVRVFELCKFPLRGLGRRQTRIFAGFAFD